MSRDAQSKQSGKSEQLIRGNVFAVCRNAEPGLPKPVVKHIYLLEDLGVEGDYHAGKLVRHRYLAKKDPTRRNLRQVLIVGNDAYAELARAGICISAGSMGENITVSGIDVMTLTEGTHVTIGEAIVEVTEVRMPCKQLNGVHPQLLKAVTTVVDGKKHYKAGIMTRVLRSGWVKADDRVIIGEVQLATQATLF